MNDLPDFRELILARLKERDRHCEQFNRIFSAYNSLSESFNHLLAKNSSDSTKKHDPKENSTAEIELLKVELNDIYKKKAINDQQLIESNKKVQELDQIIIVLVKEKDAALKRIEELTTILECMRNDVVKIQQDKQCLLDEHIALQALYATLSEKYNKADQERTDVINRLKELKNNEVTMVNDFNDRENLRAMEKLRSALADASKSNPFQDAKAAQLADVVEARCAENFGDIIPERCKIKFECNDVGEVNDCLFHPNGKHFFTASSDKKIKMWEISSDNCNRRCEFAGANQAVTRIDVDSDAKNIIGSSNDFAVRLWSVADQRQRFAFTGHSDRVTCAKFYNSGRSVVSGSNDRTLKLWDISMSRCQRTFFAGSTVLDVATNDCFGVPIISGHFDKSLRFWDVRSDSSANKILLDGKVTSLFISASKQTVLCSSRNETLSLIDIRNYGVVHIYSAEQYRSSSDFTKCVISPCDTYVAIGSADGHIFIWNLMTTRLEKVFFKGGHENSPVLCLAWHPSGHMIISGDKRKSLCLWR